MSKELVTSIVVSAGNPEYLWPCLSSLREQDYSRREIIVIGASIGSGLEQEILARYPGVIFLCKPKAFYAQALNAGIALSKGEFILCLNDDVILEKRFISQAIKGFSLGEDIGMVSGKILRFDKKTIDSAGLFLSLWRSAGERGYGQKDKGQFDQPGYVFGASGAVVFYRKEALEQVKIQGEYFDNDFGFFYEDLDLAWRLRSFGYKAYYLPQALAYHLRGLTTRNGQGIGRLFARRFLNSDLHAGLIKNRYATLIKNESCQGLLLHLPFILLYDLASWGYLLAAKTQALRKILAEPLRVNAFFKKRRAIISMLKAKRRKNNFNNAFHRWEN